MSDAVSAPERESRWSALTSIHAWMVLHFLLLASLCVTAVRWKPWGVTRTLPGSVLSRTPISADGRIVTFGGKYVVHLTDPESGASTSVKVNGNFGAFSYAMLSPGQKTLFLQTGDGSGRICDAVTGKMLHVLDAGSLLSAAFSPDGSRIATAWGDKMLRIWDVNSGEQVASAALREEESWCVCYSPNRDIIAVTSENLVYLFDVDAAPLHVLVAGETTAISVVFSPDGRQIVAFGPDEALHVWDVESGTLLHALGGHTFGVAFASFSKDGERIATAGMDGTVRIWNAKTGHRLMVLEGHEEALSSAEFSADERLVATVSPRDNTVRIWDAQTGAELCVLNELANVVWYAGFLSGDRLLVSGRGKVLILGRRHPDGWAGHLYRLEVWAAIVIGAAWLWLLVRSIRERRRAT